MQGLPTLTQPSSSPAFRSSQAHHGPRLWGPIRCSQSAATGRGHAAATRQASDWRRLNNPAKIGGKATNSVKVTDRGGAVSLEQYMRLPAEAYSSLEPGMIKPLGGGSFLLMMPRITLFHEWVAPEVEVHVTQLESPPRVVLEARSCHLRGSPFFSTLEGRFALHFRTELSWQGGRGTAGGQQQQQQRQLSGSGNGSSAQALAAAAAAGLAAQQHARQQAQHAHHQQQQRGEHCYQTSGFFGGSGSTAGAAGSAGAAGGLLRAPWGAGLAFGATSAAAAPAVPKGEITGRLSVDVWSEVPPPFTFMPREVMVGTCNAVLEGVIGALLPLFMRKLGEDYEKWAADEEYRKSRARGNAAVRAAP